MKAVKVANTELVKPNAREKPEHSWFGYWPTPQGGILVSSLTMHGSVHIREADIFAKITMPNEIKKATDIWWESLTSIWNESHSVPVLVDVLVRVSASGNVSVKRLWLWLYTGNVYRAPTDLPPADVLVLIKTMILEQEKKLTRLRKMVELAETFDKAARRDPIPEDVQLFVWQRDGGSCVKCGSKENLEYDHIIPVSKGGSNTARNIQLLCESCNRSKHDKIGG